MSLYRICICLSVCLSVCFSFSIVDMLQTKQSFRYPVSANSSGSIEVFSPNSSKGPSPSSMSKRRQKQLNMRRGSISPSPGKNLDYKLQQMQLKLDKENMDSGGEDEYGDDPSHTGDYSMDDFDEDSPNKLAHLTKRPVSTSSIENLPTTVPTLSKYPSAPLPSRVLSKEEEETKRSMDEIANRWASMSSGMYSKQNVCECKISGIYVTS